MAQLAILVSVTYTRYKGVQMTELLYMQDFNVEQCQAKVIDVAELEDGKTDIQLDVTCFYPRGGGQDWDTGTITTEDATFAVESVRLDERGIVHHIGTIQTGALSSGNTVDCAVDAKRRLINTRLHSAGHVLDMAVDSLGLDWIATKGQHFPDLSAIEYSGEWNPEKAEQLKSEIQAAANELITKGSSNSLRFVSKDELSKMCKHVPDNIPENKPCRVVMYGETFGIPCGGTHLKDVKDVGAIAITKLKAKKGVIRLSYSVEDIK